MSDAVPAEAGIRRRLFLHCIGSSVPGHDRYAERALVLARGDDVVCVPRDIEPEYLGFLSALGIGPAAANVIVAAPDTGEDSLAGRLLRGGGMVEQVARRMGAVPVALHPYAGTPEVFALARALERVSARSVRVHAATPDLLALVHDRPAMRDRAMALGIPVAEGELARLASPFGRRRRDLEPLRLAIERQLRRTGRVIVRGASGAVGSSTFVVGVGGADTDDVLRGVALAPGNRAYLVEVLVDATVCSTVHLRLEPGAAGAEVLGVSDRRFGRGLAPAGSRSPSSARTAEAMTAWALRFGGWLREAGYAGPVGLDFVEYRDPTTGEPRSFFAGVDPRAGEGTYALGLKGGLAAAAFVSGTVATRVAGFGRLREALGGLLYDPDRGNGVIPYATGCLEQGRCPVVALGNDRLHASELLGKAQAATGAWAAVDTGAARPVS
jgi:hypothetical protein